MSTAKACVVAAVLAVTFQQVPSALAQYDEQYNFGPAYVPAFANKTNGLDMLPLTADDGVAVLNLGGSLSCDVIDLNGALGGLNLDWSFHNRMNDDDEQISMTIHSEFNLGIIAEGETWCDMRQDNGTGATGSGPDGTLVAWSGKDWDWELNDSSWGNGQPGCPNYSGWESGSDYFWYNNADANQRGLGGSRYYFEYKNPDIYPGTPIFDEPEKYRHTNRLDHVWAANPGNGNGDNRFGADLNVEIRGFLIPISAIHSLPHGSLSQLFGWQSVDMADYVRDVIGGYVDADGNPINGLQVWDPWGDGGYNDPANSNPPPYKYLLIYQASDVVSGSCSDGNVPAAMAYYGMTNGVSGTRRSHILFKGDASDGNQPIDIATPPADPGFPQIVNSWGRDDMIRDNYSDFGNLQTGTGVGWAFGPAGTPDGRILTLPAGAAADQAWTKLPTMQLPARNLGVIVGKARVALDTGLTAGNQIHLALVNGTTAVASAVIKIGRPPTVGVGGTIVGGPVTGSASSLEPPNPDADGNGTVDKTDYGVFVGCATGPGIPYTAPDCRNMDLDQDMDVDLDDFGIFQRCYSGAGVLFDHQCTNVGFTISPGTDYMDLALWYEAATGSVNLTLNGETVANYSTGSATGPFVDGIYLWTSSAETLFVDTLGVYSGAFTCNVVPGDVNGDGVVDAADDAARHACYSGPGVPYRTGIFPCCACLDLDGDNDVDADDGVTP